MDQQAQDNQLISRKGFARKLGKSPSTIKHHERNTPGFPRAIRVDGFRPMYSLAEVEAWIAARAAERPKIAA